MKFKWLVKKKSIVRSRPSADTFLATAEDRKFSPTVEDAAARESFLDHPAGTAVKGSQERKSYLQYVGARCAYAQGTTPLITELAYFLARANTVV